MLLVISGNLGNSHDIITSNDKLMPMRQRRHNLSDVIGFLGPPDMGKWRSTLFPCLEVLVLAYNHADDECAA